MEERRMRRRCSLVGKDCIEVVSSLGLLRDQRAEEKLADHVVILISIMELFSSNFSGHITLQGVRKFSSAGVRSA
jgi:hypothetical protein